MVLRSPNTHPPPQQLAPSYKSLYMALFSCVNDAIAICFVGQEYPKQIKGSKWPMNDQIRRRRHTGTHDQGSEVRVHRSLMGSGRDLYFLFSFVLLTVRLEPSVQLRIPARCSKEPAASFSSSSSSGLTSRFTLLPAGHLMAGGRRDVW